jgi:ABC-type uncharacterized transport system YnjBCD substrate-binding protein
MLCFGRDGVNGFKGLRIPALIQQRAVARLLYQFAMGDEMQSRRKRLHVILENMLSTCKVAGTAEPGR